MVMRREVSTPRLWAMAVLALLAAGVLAARGDAEPDPIARVAVERYEEIQRVLWEARETRIDEVTRRELQRTDPARSGLVGVEWSGVVTTAGSLDAKRASASPGWVLLYRRWFSELGLQPGDRIAINSSASFPALHYAARVAAESMSLECNAVISLTASNYGATVAGFDLLAIEQTLLDRRLLEPCVVGVTPGGHGDAALDLDDASRQRILARLASARGIETLVPPSLEESRAFRQRLLLGDPPPALYINMGGHITGYGTGARALAVRPGITMPGDVAANGLPESVIGDALAAGVPVLHLLDIRGILADEGLSVTDGFLLPELSTPVRVMAGAVVVLFLVCGWLAGSAVPLIPGEGDLIS